MDKLLNIKYDSYRRRWGQVGKLEFFEYIFFVDMIWSNVNILNNYLKNKCKKAISKNQKQNETTYVTNCWHTQRKKEFKTLNHSNLTILT